MLALSALLLSSAAAEASHAPLAAAAEVAANRVRGCGFDHVGVKDDRELQEEVVFVSGVSAVPEAKMRCAVQVSLDTVRYVIFPEPAGDAYWRLYFKMEEEQDHGRTAGWVQGDARAWLQKHGMVGKVPIYRKRKAGDLEFARQLEHLCGSKATGAFGLFRGHVIVQMGTPYGPAMDEPTFECLLKVIAASGMPFGFVGNEAYRK